MNKIIYMIIVFNIILYYPSLLYARNLLEFKFFYDRNNVLIHTNRGLEIYHTIKYKKLIIYTKSKMFYKEDISRYRFIMDEKYIPSDFVYGFKYDFTDNIVLKNVNGYWKEQYWIIFKIEFKY